MEQDVLLEITMDDNITQNFESLLIDILDYSMNVLSTEYDYCCDEFEDYKEFVHPKDIHIQFRRNNEPIDDFNVDMYVKAGNNIKEWEYADSLTESAFIDGTKFI